MRAAYEGLVIVIGVGVERIAWSGRLGGSQKLPFNKASLGRAEIVRVQSLVHQTRGGVVGLKGLSIQRGWIPPAFSTGRSRQVVNATGMVFASFLVACPCSDVRLRPDTQEWKL